MYAYSSAFTENLVKTLDDEEVEFLDYVDQVRLQDDKRKRLEEAKELSEFRSAVSQLREKEFEKALQSEIGLGDRVNKNKTKLPEPPSIGIKKTSQTQLLAGLVKRKTVETEAPETGAKKAKQEGMLMDITIRITPLLLPFTLLLLLLMLIVTYLTR